MRKRRILWEVLVTALFVLIILLTYMLTRQMRVKEEQYQRTKDSLEVEYYKKQLESYPDNHSEIKDSIK